MCCVRNEFDVQPSTKLGRYYYWIRITDIGTVALEEKEYISNEIIYYDINVTNEWKWKAEMGLLENFFVIAVFYFVNF